MAQVEERLLADDDYFDRLSAVEHELIDGFLRGELSRSDRDRFEQSYLISRHRHERLEFARALLASASSVREAEIAGPERIGFRLSLSRFLGGLKPAHQFSLAAALLLVIAGGSWLTVETSRLRTRIAALQARQGERQAAEQERERRAAQQSRVIAQLNEQLRQERNRRTELEQEFTKPRPSPGIIISFVLTPGLVRDPQEAKRLVIPANAGGVRIQLDVDREAEYKSYRAAVRTPAGDEIWSEDMLMARPTGAGKAVVLRLPGSVLATGDYVITLQGVTRRGGLEDLESYHFSVQKL